MSTTVELFQKYADITLVFDHDDYQLRVWMKKMRGAQFFHEGYGTLECHFEDARNISHKKEAQLVQIVEHTFMKIIEGCLTNKDPMIQEFMCKDYCVPMYFELQLENVECIDNIDTFTESVRETIQKKLWETRLVDYLACYLLDHIIDQYRHYVSRVSRKPRVVNWQDEINKFLNKHRIVGGNTDKTLIVTDLLTAINLAGMLNYDDGDMNKYDVLVYTDGVDEYLINEQNFGDVLFLMTRDKCFNHRLYKLMEALYFLDSSKFENNHVHTAITPYITISPSTAKMVHDGDYKPTYAATKLAFVLSIAATLSDDFTNRFYIKTKQGYEAAEKQHVESVLISALEIFDKLRPYISKYRIPASIWRKLSLVMPQLSLSSKVYPDLISRVIGIPVEYSRISKLLTISITNVSEPYDVEIDWEELFTLMYSDIIPLLNQYACNEVQYGILKEVRENGDQVYIAMDLIQLGEFIHDVVIKKQHIRFMNGIVDMPKSDVWEYYFEGERRFVVPVTSMDDIQTTYSSMIA